MSRLSSLAAIRILVLILILILNLILIIRFLLRLLLLIIASYLSLRVATARGAHRAACSALLESVIRVSVIRVRVVCQPESFRSVIIIAIAVALFDIPKNSMRRVLHALVSFAPRSSSIFVSSACLRVCSPDRAMRLPVLHDCIGFALLTDLSARFAALGEAAFSALWMLRCLDVPAASSVAVRNSARCSQR